MFSSDTNIMLNHIQQMVYLEDKPLGYYKGYYMSPLIAFLTNMPVESSIILACIMVIAQAMASSYLSLAPRMLAPLPPRQLGWYLLCSFSA